MKFLTKRSINLLSLLLTLGLGGLGACANTPVWRYEREVKPVPQEKVSAAQLSLDMWDIPIESPFFGTHEARLRAHHALFDLFFPWEQLRPQGKIFQYGLKLRQTLGQKLTRQEKFKAILTLFSNLSLLGEATLLKALYFAYLPPEERDRHEVNREALAKLQSFTLYPAAEFLPGIWTLKRPFAWELLKLMSESAEPLLRQMVVALEDEYRKAIYAPEFYQLLFEDLVPRRNRETAPKHPGVEREREFFPAPNLTGIRLIDSSKVGANLRSNFSHKVQGVIDTYFDYIIVGAGVAGTVLASHLSEKGKKVLLLDQGSFPVPGRFESAGFSPYLRQVRDGSLNNLHQSLLLPEVVGGGSSVGYDVFLAPPEDQPDNLLFGVKRTAFPHRGWARAWEWGGETFVTQTLVPDDLSGFDKDFYFLFGNANFSDDEDKRLTFMHYPRGFSPYRLTRKKNLITSLLMPKMEADNLVVLSHARSEQLILSSDNLVTGVTFSIAKKKFPDDFRTYSTILKEGEYYQVFGRKVILAAGLYGNMTLLRASGLERGLSELAPESWNELTLVARAPRETQASLLPKSFVPFELVDGSKLTSPDSIPNPKLAWFGRKVIDREELPKILRQNSFESLRALLSDNWLGFSLSYPATLTASSSAGDLRFNARGLPLAENALNSTGRLPEAIEKLLEKIKGRLRDSGLRDVQLVTLSGREDGAPLITKSRICGGFVSSSDLNSVLDLRFEHREAKNLHLFDSSVISCHNNFWPMGQLAYMARAFGQLLEN